MKHLFFVAMILSLAGMCSARPTIPGTHGPLLSIDTTNSNFGAVPNLGNAVRTFRLSNLGDAPLHITMVHPTCGCTIVALKDSTLAPGQSTGLKVSLSANHRAPGNFYKTIYITSNSTSGEGAWLRFYGHFVDANETRAQK